MYKLEFTLKQHTPIIHFQHDQEGATLRATEVKPKFDRFLIEKKEEFEFNRKGKDSLPYQIKITSNQVRSDIIGIEKFEAGNKGSIPLVLANMGKEQNKKKKFVFSENPIQIIFFSKHNDLLKEIKFYFPEFIFFQNFGNRASKGFGSFYLDPEFKQEYVEISEYDEKLFFDIDLPNSNNFLQNLEVLGLHINYFHKSIRSGIQEGIFDKIIQKFKTTYYQKSILSLYAKIFGIQWDKKVIKTELIGLESEKQLIGEKKLFKELLGLSKLETWKKVKNLGEDKVLYENVEITRELEIPISEDENFVFDRLSSPFNYKPILILGDTQANSIYRVYLLKRKSRPQLVNAKLKISVDKPTVKSESYSIAYDEFDINKYFNFLFGKDKLGNYLFDIQSLVPSEFHSIKNKEKNTTEIHPTLSTVVDIFSKIRSNFNSNS